MTLRTEIYIAIACIVVLTAAIITFSVVSNRELARSEHDVRSAKAKANAAETRSRELESTAAEYKEKLEYMEVTLSGLRRIAMEQNEQIKLLESTTNDARRNADRAHAVRRIESTAAELCQKLADIGHPCE